MIFKTLKSKEYNNLIIAADRLTIVINNIRAIAKLRVDLYRGLYDPLAESFRKYMNRRNRVDSDIRYIDREVQEILILDEKIKNKTYKQDSFRMYVIDELKETTKVLTRKRNGLRVMEAEFDLSKAGTEYYERQAQILREREKERRL